MLYADFFKLINAQKLIVFYHDRIPEKGTQIKEIFAYCLLAFAFDYGQMVGIASEKAGKGF
jgi:hypothetical protein